MTRIRGSSALSARVEAAFEQLALVVPAATAADLVLALLVLATPCPRTKSILPALLRTGQRDELARARESGLGALFDVADHLPAELDLRPAASLCEGLVEPDLAGLVALGVAHERLLALVSERTAGLASRRRWGSHYTPLDLATRVVRTALDHAALRSGPRLEGQGGFLTLCDPAMGGGVFLLVAARELSSRTGRSIQEIVPCLHGIDRDERAVWLARFCLHTLAGSPDEPVDVFCARLVVGDALLPAPAGLVWPEAFPHIFPGGPAGSAAGGFTVFVGNPPFVGGKRIATHLGEAYARGLRTVHPESSGNADLAAHFFRRAFDRLAPGGVLGFVTTSSIAKGETRRGGLEILCSRGATIVEAERSLAWPGDASVQISVVHLVKGPSLPGETSRLDGTPVPSISAFLEVGDRSEPPPRRSENRGLAYVGCYLRGMGFTFDDRAPEAMPTAIRDALLAADPSLAARLRPYLGGDEVARDPEQRPHRFVLDLNDLTLDDEARFPELFGLVRRYVKPGRDKLGTSSADRAHRTQFHVWANPRPELRRAIAGLDRVLVTPRVSIRRFFTFLPADVVPSEQLVVFALPGFASFAVLQSTLHDIWARTFGSSMGRAIRYTPSDVFETFPLPAGFLDDPRLEEVGKSLYEARAQLLRDQGIGLGELYTTLAAHPTLPALRTLRALHRGVDEAVAAAYELPSSLLTGVELGEQTSAAARALVERLREWPTMRPATDA